MNALEIIGLITTSIIVIVIIHKAFRRMFPKKYTERNCREDHDTMSRYGSPRCDKCGTEFNAY